MPLADGPHLDLLREAIAVEAVGQTALLAGDLTAGGEQMRRAAELYRESWELAPPGSYGRLIGMLKASVIAGNGSAAAAYARTQLPDPPETPPAAYALAIAALVAHDDGVVASASAVMRNGSPAFVRAADAIDGLVAGDAARYATGLGLIVADFEAREEHLTGVAIADTALMLEYLAEARGIASRPSSPLLPAASGID
ncbi:MAG: hypothetical protein ACYDHH_16140 [Solirubrobacteraceae bacterium]